MINNKICFIYSFLFLTLLSCKKNVEVGPPITQLATSSVFTDNNTATAAQLVLYSQMRTDPYNLARITGLSSDELFTYATGQVSKDLYANTLNAATDGGSISTWPVTYNYIYEENAVLEGIGKSDLLSPAVKQQLTGEAVFLRTFWYFYLTNLYGDVPLITTTDYKINTALPRAPQQQVYQRIIADLKNAENLLNSDYVDASDTVITSERVRPTKWAATALLARTYLYSKNYDSAESRATVVINNPIFQIASLDDVFFMNSSEAIWQLMPLSTAFAATEGLYFILNTSPATGNNNSSTISTQLMGTFEAGDNRKTHWIGSYTKNGSTYFFPNKYKDGSASRTLREYSMILRLAEQYLIRAEARARQGNISGTGGALADLNVIRHRAGLLDYSGSMDQASVIAAIQHERQVELFAEAHRWFDLKRTGTVDAVMSLVTPMKKGNTWSSYQQFYPIPITDVQNSLTLTQTPGYN